MDGGNKKLDNPYVQYATDMGDPNTRSRFMSPSRLKLDKVLTSGAEFAKTISLIDMKLWPAPVERLRYVQMPYLNTQVGQLGDIRFRDEVGKVTDSKRHPKT